MPKSLKKSVHQIIKFVRPHIRRVNVAHQPSIIFATWYWKVVLANIQIIHQMTFSPYLLVLLHGFIKEFINIVTYHHTTFTLL